MPAGTGSHPDSNITYGAPEAWVLVNGKGGGRGGSLVSALNHVEQNLADVTASRPRRGGLDTLSLFINVSQSEGLFPIHPAQRITRRHTADVAGPERKRLLYPGRPSRRAKQTHARDMLSLSGSVRGG